MGIFISSLDNRMFLIAVVWQKLFPLSISPVVQNKRLTLSFHVQSNDDFLSAKIVCLDPQYESSDP